MIEESIFTYRVIMGSSEASTTSPVEAHASLPVLNRTKRKPISKLLLDKSNQLLHDSNRKRLQRRRCRLGHRNMLRDSEKNRRKPPSGGQPDNMWRFLRHQTYISFSRFGFFLVLLLLCLLGYAQSWQPISSLFSSFSFSHIVKQPRVIKDLIGNRVRALRSMDVVEVIAGTSIVIERIAGWHKLSLDFTAGASATYCEYEREDKGNVIDGRVEERNLDQNNQFNRFGQRTIKTTTTITTAPTTTATAKATKKSDMNRTGGNMLLMDWKGTAASASTAVAAMQLNDSSQLSYLRVHQMGKKLVQKVPDFALLGVLAYTSAELIQRLATQQMSTMPPMLRSITNNTVLEMDNKLEKLSLHKWDLDPFLREELGGVLGPSAAGLRVSGSLQQKDALEMLERFTVTEIFDRVDKEVSPFLTKFLADPQRVKETMTYVKDIVRLSSVLLVGINNNNNNSIKNINYTLFNNNNNNNNNIPDQGVEAMSGRTIWGRKREGGINITKQQQQQQQQEQVLELSPLIKTARGRKKEEIGALDDQGRLPSKSESVSGNNNQMTVLERTAQSIAENVELLALSIEEATLKWNNNIMELGKLTKAENILSRIRPSANSNSSTVPHETGNSGTKTTVSAAIVEEKGKNNRENHRVSRRRRFFLFCRRFLPKFQGKPRSSSIDSGVVGNSSTSSMSDTNKS